jgi:hypothetical protein
LHAATAGVACGLQLALHGPMNRVHGGDSEKSGVETDLGTAFIRQARTGKILEYITLSLNTTRQFSAVILHFIQILTHKFTVTVGAKAITQIHPPPTSHPVSKATFSRHPFLDPTGSVGVGRTERSITWL